MTNRRASAISAGASSVPLSPTPRKREQTGECASPGCHEPLTKGARFCSEHAAVLASVRDELATESERRRDRKGRGGSSSTCCNPSCWNPREPAAAFCESCDAAGWRQELE